MNIEIKRPTRDEVQNLKVGDLVLNVFGKYQKVVDIFGCGDDINGKAYVCFHAEFGHLSTMSGSYKQGEIVRTFGICNKYTSAEIQNMEKN